MEWFIGEYERARPIFDRRRRQFHPIERIAEVQVGQDFVDLVLATCGGSFVRGRITFPDPEVVRLQWSDGGEPGEHLSEMLVGPPPRLALTVSESENEVVVDAGGPPLVLGRSPWRVSFGAYRTEPEDTSLLEHVAEPGGWAADLTADCRVQAYETFSLRPGEQLWGMGERFLGPGLRGRRVAHFINEPGGTNTTDRVYKSVPLVVSSRGYGLFLHHSEEATFDLGATSSVSGSILVDAPELDLFVMLGKPKDVLRRYTALTGRAPVPPEWTFGIWLSKCMYESRQEVEANLAEAARRGITIDVIGLDPLWLLNRAGYDFDFCDFVWNDQAFGPLEEFTSSLHERGIRLCLWVNPNVLEGSEAFVPERLVAQGRARDACFPVRGFVDFTGAGADWWVEEMQRLLALGVDAFKLDYGELAPVNAVYADGRSGHEVHNLYGLLGSMTAHRAGVPFAYTRSGTAGSQRYPTHWPGDAQSTWAGMAGNLRGGLASAWSGFSFWSTDIGGFFARDLTVLTEGAGHPLAETNGVYRPDPELFIRWSQYGLLCSHGRFHGMLGREPWLFGDEAVDVIKRFIALRTDLRPYLIEQAEVAAETGCPVMRPVALEFPDDPGARNVDTEFLLGAALLVAPVLEPGGDVELYVPEGRWTDHFTGALYTGPCWVRLEAVPIDRIPLLVRDGYTPFGAPPSGEPS